MTDLNAQQLKDVFNQIVDEYILEKPSDLTKDDFKAAAQSISNWIDDNAASANSALPQPFRSSASIQIKATLLAFVALRKFRG